MKTVYHEGELAVQTRAGVREMSARIGKSIRSTIPLAAQEFLGSQPMAVFSSIDSKGKVWASRLLGNPGFMRTLNERTIEIDALFQNGDPLRKNLEANATVGMIVIEFATRRRMRINGTVELMPGSNAEEGSESPASKLYIHTEQVYANCPKYIQARSWKSANTPAKSDVVHSTELTDHQQKWIANADTFFIATYHPDGGADVSHRGGNPGFIRIIDHNKIVWPDYSGNTMFQTLGNLSVYPNSGLLFIDFTNGSTLQLTGSAEIIWDQNRIHEFNGAERLVEYSVTEGIENHFSNSFHSEFQSYSPFNPSL
jgi:predicted pyridoxine 5'-phosphate oxidase superfamily flavin-nucleotide-binding protein